ncbi:ATPase, partial [mine drainage metagenome]
EVFALFPLEIFSRSIKSKGQYPKKVYVVDNGLVQLITRKIDQGRLMENIVFIELYRRSHALQLFSINYWKEYGKAEGREVDFVINQAGKVVELINVTYASSREDIHEREVNSLLQAGQELACNNLKIITWDYVAQEQIEFVPLWRWLINPRSKRDKV